MKFKMSNEPLSIFSFSSLTDIVMLLLIFFLITSQFVVQTGVKVKLPGSKTNEQQAPSPLVVTLAESGKMFVGKDEANWNTLPSRLEKLVAKKAKGRMLVIRADKSVNIDNVIKVMDAAKGVGIDKFTIGTEKISY
ncbi:MAG: ExbD/TolR family protein [Rhodothermaceae bacterium]